jgi:cyclic pyranopterin phosphate synthase
MEAIMGVSTGLAGLYDTLKSLSHQMSLGLIKLLKKDGGRSGTITEVWPECPFDVC